jgi:predicted MPP superfamily phosphohydrolase
MRTLIHLSDLHFGRVDPVIVTPLLDFIRATNPDLVAISGDLTQRARTPEFQSARRFLDAIPFPQIVVPGNHDVPLYNLFSRFLRKLNRYQCFISADLEPFYRDSEIAVSGVNTARARLEEWSHYSPTARKTSRSILERAGGESENCRDASSFRPPGGVSGDHVVGRAQLAIQTLAECRVDLFLAGHFHVGATGHTATRYPFGNYSALIVSSGTSTRDAGADSRIR